MLREAEEEALEGRCSRQSPVIVLGRRTGGTVLPKPARTYPFVLGAVVPSWLTRMLNQ